MPSYWCAASIVIAAAVATPNTAAQQPGSAGATRPSLRVLQALPESQLFPLMNLLADSLGVKCDYCHVQVQLPFRVRTSDGASYSTVTRTFDDALFRPPSGAR
jgi:hypothetical protein